MKCLFFKSDKFWIYNLQERRAPLSCQAVEPAIFLLSKSNAKSAVFKFLRVYDILNRIDPQIALPEIINTSLEEGIRDIG